MGYTIKKPILFSIVSPVHSIVDETHTAVLQHVKLKQWQHKIRWASGLLLTLAL